ncbi:methylmalonyl-CoA mutase family protein, partial [Chloroflexota bacterium]
WNSISICGYHMREAGSTAIQEAAFTLANAVTYVQAMIDRGMPVDSFAPRFTFMMACNLNLMEETAKFRAMRRVWANIMKERFGALDERSMMFRFHVQNDGYTSTAQQPINNIIRTTIAAMACVMAGCQSLCTTSYDEALALPSEESVRIALRTQQIIAYESGIADTADPMGGGYYLEWLTNQIELGIYDYLDRIKNMGGAPEAVRKGFIQREISTAAYNYQMAVDSGEKIVVGLNRFTQEEDVEFELLQVDESTGKKQVARLVALRQQRDNRAVKQALTKVKEVAKSHENIMPVLIEAVKTYATVGEISEVMREVFGEYEEPDILSKS